MNKQTLISILIILAVVVFGLIFLQKKGEKPRIYDNFATCLGEAGAKFYGAFWCPHCGKQKQAFGPSQDKLPYIECSTADSRGQTEACIAAGIQSYPTWEFADGTRVTGEQSLETLAEKTGCALPTGDSSSEIIEEGVSSEIKP